MGDKPELEREYGASAGHAQERLPLARDGVQTVVWHLPHCTILIETRDGICYVKGSPVEPMDVTLKRNKNGDTGQEKT